MGSKLLCIQGLVLVQELLDGCEITVLGSLMQGQGRLFNLLERRLKLDRQAAHLLTDLQHQLFVLVVLHDGFHAVLLDVLEDGRQLRIGLQGLDLVLDRCVAFGHLGAVVLCDGLGLQPAPHGIGVLGKALQRLCSVWVALDIGPHLRPRFVIHIRQPADLHGGAIANLQRLGGHACARKNRQRGTVGFARVFEQRRKSDSAGDSHTVPQWAS